MNNKYTQDSSMWKSFDDLASRVDRLEKHIMPLSDKELSDKIKEIYAPMLRDHLSASSIRFEQFAPKKEVKEMANTIHLVLSAEGFAKFVLDNQKMAKDSKLKVDKNGNSIYNAEIGDYETVEIPVADRWVSLGDMRINADGKYVVKVTVNTLNSMDQLNAREERIKAYETA